MNRNYVTKSILALAVLQGIAGCGDEYEIGDSVDSSQIQPVEVANTNILIEVGETESAKAYDLIQGLTNPHPERRVFTTKFKRIVYVDDAGEELDVPQNADLPPESIVKQGEKVFVNPSAWLDILEYQESAEYDFTYYLDNGSNEEVLQNLRIKIVGEEVKAEQVDILAEDNAEIPVGQSVQIETSIMPANTTFKEITWSSSDTSVFTVAADGTVTAVATGTANLIGKTYDDGITATKPLTVVTDSTKPIGVDITNQGQSIETIVVEEGQTITLGANVLFQNETADSNKNVSWNSSAPGFFEISDKGALTGIKTYESGVLTVKTESQGFTDSIMVNVKQNSNILYSFNSSFEKAEIEPWTNYWENPAGTVLESVEGTSTAGNRSLHITSDGSKNVGINLAPSVAPQHLGSNDGKTYKLTFDIKSNNGTVEGWFRAIPQGGWPERWDGWWKHDVSAANADGWSTITVEKSSKDWSAYTVLGRMDLYISAPGKAVDVYIDNIRIAPVTSD
ncbi:Ig domain-containing protein group 2 domain-containing protein [Catenovulum agarivorans DS-2]|uniref:Ig domain-containing protein group 2 domain-containing protein n=1 Tax=Catenovulum agarivorans DS-2 TaxID=1328313 RepID=W7QU42_9ALTE|nr:Ig-like domain-containing protein [Catenovulum agarivorans]EWH08970.1 Ig domain-containing protein group 2 domain-containing protein [Catenovulum agarivorans DS-2]